MAPIEPYAVKAVLSTLAYFSVFKHPLRYDELQSHSHFDVLSKNQLNQVLQIAIGSNVIKQSGSYYILGDKSEILRRTIGEENAHQAMQKAEKFSEIISQFPFVKGVALSGSISKGYMDADSDVDYFIITAPGKLWICRTLLILYKKIILLNSRKFFCLNYFVDENNLAIPDQNIFTATEIVFLKTMYGPEAMNSFFKANEWIFNFYPSAKIDVSAKQIAKPWISTFAEKICSTWLCNIFEVTLRKVTVLFWRIKFGKRTPEWHQAQMRNKAGVSKHHPNGFQVKVMEAHEQILQSCLEKLSL
ncbi:MAG: nucleotidyltransferase domain-containing protein [Bacteroidetes bacterium]|nr:nucleotidyltransferase domain-containing protein [Bacteroidota bacterium]